MDHINKRVSSPQQKDRNPDTLNSNSVKSTQTSYLDQQQQLHEKWQYKLTQLLLQDLIGGPKLIKQRYVINTFKGLTYFFITALIWYYQNFSYGAYLYLAIHGSYGIIWVIKDVTFPDKSWDFYITIPSAIFNGLGLMLYWILPWMMISGIGIQNPTNSRLVTVIFLYIFGVCLMLVSDSQKHYTLKYKKGLINDGLFKYTRNPNYLGEMALYTSFAVMIGDYRAYFIPILFWCTLFSLNMYKKEYSLQLKKGWEVYKNQSYLLLPKIFYNDYLNLICYGLFAFMLYYDYRVGGGITLLKKQ